MEHGAAGSSACHSHTRCRHSPRTMYASCSRPQEDRPEKAWRLAPSGLGRGEVCARVGRRRPRSRRAEYSRHRDPGRPPDAGVDPSDSQGQPGATSARLPGAGAQAGTQATGSRPAALWVSTTSRAATWSLTWAAARGTVRVWGSPGLDCLIELVCASYTCMTPALRAGLSCI